MQGYLLVSKRTSWYRDWEPIFNQCSIKRELSKKRIQKFQHKSTAFERTALQIMSLKNETLKANKQ